MKNRIDLSRAKLQIHVPTPEISVKVQEELFKAGHRWPCGGQKSTDADFPYIQTWGDKGLTRSRHESDGGYTSVNYQDIIGPSLPFQVGDKVRAFGIDGTVKRIQPGSKDYSIKVVFEGGQEVSFEEDGRYFTWAKEQALTLVERPPKTEKRKFYVWSYNGEIITRIMDESYRDVNGNTSPMPAGDYKKIPGTEITLEVTL